MMSRECLLVLQILRPHSFRENIINLGFSSEHHIAKISSAAHAFAVSSGMAALDVILRILKPGDEVIAGDDLYGGTNRLLSYLRTHVGVIVHHVDTTDPKSVIPFIKADKTAMVLLESPTNPLLKIVDLANISKDVKERAPNAVVVVDNTMMSPYLQRPLDHGADIVYDSGTKYLSGHHDLMAGVITCNRDDLAKVRI
jgi:cystathionine beta-lyase/cystathionine gamma-synthase